LTLNETTHNPSQHLAHLQRERRNLHVIEWTLLLVIFASVFVGAMFTPGLLDDADATHAEAAREMAVTGDYVTLHVNGVRYLEKPALPYWCAALAMHVFGQTEFAVRLPITLAVLLAMFLMLSWGKRAFGSRAGFYAALFSATCIGTFLFTRIFIPEALLSLFLFGSLYFFLTALDLRSAPRWYAFYAMLALALLAKGLVAPVFAGGAIIIFLFITGEWRRWREFRLPSGLLLFFAIGAPWHILAGLRNTGGADGHGFFWFYFINEHVLRFLGKRFPKDYNKMPAAAYWLSHLAWLFPWSLFLPLSVRRFWRQLHTPHAHFATFADRTRLLCWIYAILILVFFAISTNQEYYTFPVYLPLCLLIADALAHREANDPTGWVKAAHWLLAVSGVITAAVLASALWQSRNVPFVADVGTVLARRAVGAYTLSMSHFFDLTDEAFAGLRLPAILAAISFLVGPVIALLLRLRRKHRSATVTVAITAAMFLIAAHIAFARFEPFLSSRQVARVLAPQLRPQDTVAIYGDQANGSSLLFYLRRPIMLVNGRTTSMYFGSTFPDVPDRFLDDSSLARLWHSDRRVYLFVPDSKRNAAARVIGNARAVFEESGKIVYVNH